MFFPKFYSLVADLKHLNTSEGEFNLVTKDLNHHIYQLRLSEHVILTFGLENNTFKFGYNAKLFLSRKNLKMIMRFLNDNDCTMDKQEASKMVDLKELADNLNEKFGSAGKFYVSMTEETGEFNISLETKDYISHFLSVDMMSKGWNIDTGFVDLSQSIQFEIIKFLSENDYRLNHKEPKYNVIVGIGETDNDVAAYVKLDDGIYAVYDSVDEDDLNDDLYQLTESEIEELKSQLSDEMAQIVEIGKREV